MPRASLVLAFVVFAFCTTAVNAAAPSENLWVYDIPGATVNGVPANRYQPGVPASLLRPSTMRIVIPYDARWRQNQWYLATDNYIDTGSLTVVHKSGNVTSQPLGMLIPVADRPVKRAIPTVPVPMDVAPNRPIVATVQTETDLPRLVLVSAPELAKADAADRRQLSYPLLLVCGMLLALALCNLIYFAGSRDQSYIFYCGVILTAILVTLRSSLDLTWAWAFPHLSARYAVVEIIEEGAFVGAIVAFAHSFLGMRPFGSRISTAMIATWLLYFGSMVVAGLFFDTYFWHRAVDVLIVAALSLVLAAGIAAQRRGHETARFYVVAFFGVFAGIVSYTIGKIFFHVWLWTIPTSGVCWEGFWLTAALADRLNKLNKAKEDEHRARLAEQEFAAIHDPLTGLYNRRKIEAELRGIEAGAGASRNALIYVDLDHFKIINDTSGHEAGDQLLVMVAGILRDSTGARDMVARVGGDEFVMLVRDKSEEQISATAERVRDAIARSHFSVGPNRFPISASIGCALLRGGVLPSFLLALADAACTQAKDAGRNRIHFVSDEISAESARQEMLWTSRINSAFESNRFRLYYQSIVPLRENARQRHIEILLRMLDEDGRVVEPSHFAPAAERYNLMAKLDRWVISTALPLLASPIANGELQSVSINLSGSSLRDEGLAQFIAGELRSSGLDPSALCLEITETVVASALEPLSDLTSALRASGVRFALDDFGTGTSSLSLLKRLQVDYLKIDGSFVRDCAVNPVDTAMVEAIHSLAKVLGLQTIAEYASSDAVVVRLREIGVDFAQGWAFNRAQPIEELTGVVTA